MQVRYVKIAIFDHSFFSEMIQDRTIVTMERYTKPAPYVAISF